MHSEEAILLQVSLSFPAPQKVGAGEQSQLRLRWIRDEVMLELVADRVLAQSVRHHRGPLAGYSPFLIGDGGVNPGAKTRRCLHPSPIPCQHTPSVVDYPTRFFIGPPG